MDGSSDMQAREVHADWKVTDAPRGDLSFIDLIRQVLLAAGFVESSFVDGKCSADGFKVDEGIPAWQPSCADVIWDTVAPVSQDQRDAQNRSYADAIRSAGFRYGFRGTALVRVADPRATWVKIELL